nr:transcriptional regulator [Methanobrevibacter sp.]
MKLDCDTIDDQTLKTYAYVQISSYRVKTVKALKDEAKIPTNIAKDTGILPNHMSKVLKEFKEAGVAECINEEVRKADYTD